MSRNSRNTLRSYDTFELAHTDHEEVRQAGGGESGGVLARHLHRPRGSDPQQDGGIRAPPGTGV